MQISCSQMGSKNKGPDLAARAFVGNRSWDAEPTQGIVLLAQSDRLSVCYTASR